MGKTLRVQKSIMNVKVNMFFYLLSFLFAFISRKVFLDSLSADFVGLAGTLAEIIGLLYLAEMGISTSIAYFLYKPLQEGNRAKINEIMSVLGYMYRMVGSFIGIAGVAVSVAFPFIFTETQLPLLFIYFTFYSYISSALINFYLNYRQILLTADQRNYVVSAYTQAISYTKTGLQIFLAYYYKNLYLWVAVEFIFSWITCIVLNNRINKAYPWLEIRKYDGKRLLKLYPDILAKSKQLFVHNIKNFALRGSDQIFIFAFVSLKMVAFYGNYMILFNKVNVLVNVLSDGMNAGVGNLVAENDIKNTMKVFWELTAIRFFFVGIIITGFLYFTEPFIVYWLGEQYLMDRWVLYLILINLFIMLSRGTVEMYIASYGLFGDVWAAWTELGLNLVITIVGGYYWGIWGILIAKVVSSFGIALFWKPYYLFRNGLKLPVWEYWKGMIPYYVLLAVMIGGSFPMRLIITTYVHNMFILIVAAVMYVVVFGCIYLVLLYYCTRGMKYFVARVPAVHRIFNLLHL